MKVYFSGSIHGRDSHEGEYQAIVKDLGARGYKVQSAHVLGVDKKKLSEVNDKYRIDYYKRLIKWISEADFVVAEVSHGSISIGHEISLALEKGKNVIALTTNDNRGPAILLAIKSDKLQMIKYNVESLHLILDKAIQKARLKTDIRFNFFISPEINEYLDWFSRVKRLPRAVYIRELLEKEMAKNKQYRSGKS